MKFKNSLINGKMIVNKKNYRGFIFNANNTIFDHNRAEKEALYETCKTLNIFIPFEEIYLLFKEVNNRLWKEIVKNKMTMSTLKVERFRILINKLNIKCDSYELSEFYLNSLSHKSYLLPNSVKMLEYLSKKAMLCLITNGFSYVQKTRIARANIEVFFNSILISEEIGIVKPNPAIFNIAASKLFLPPHEILCTGNDPFTDIRGGYYAGMDTCLFSTDIKHYPDTETRPTITISDIMDLLTFTYEFS
jgi:YjjG family noncanonical pyrimidine nucleotidase